MRDKIGTLEAGRLADLVVLDRDYMTIPVDEIPTAAVSRYTAATLV